MSSTRVQTLHGALPGTRSVVRRRRDGMVDGAQPFIVIWEVTRACQLACVHCRAEAIPHRDPHELSTDEGRALLDDLAALEIPRPMVVLTGGDPLERPDLVELVAYGTGLGLRVAVSPSVTPRLTRDAIDALHRAGAKALSLSLDGSTAATHDRFRQVDGVFDATMRAIDDARNAGLRLQINTTVTADNVWDLPDILRLVLEARAAVWSVFFLVPTGRGTKLRPLTGVEEEDVLNWLYDVSGLVAIKTTEAPHYRRVVIQRSSGRVPPRRGALGRHLNEEVIDLTDDRPPERPRRRPINVNAGNGFVFVDHHGDVYPSGFLPESVGSIRQDSIVDIYCDAPLLRALRDPDALSGKCGRCAFREVCGGSRSRAYAGTGDALAEDPSCVFQPSGSATAAR
ncbi:MAG TPA: TIGR04053 family radical SAM/SPASM domain-containing protein [Acidimicrobiales bacterium]|nr:TIGR04053 family radical SAM/SPASM domain-containing protein [Acidimicrobiales bacterium]